MLDCIGRQGQGNETMIAHTDLDNYHARASIERDDLNSQVAVISRQEGLSDYDL